MPFSMCGRKTWKTLCKKKKSSWNPKDHELFGKLDLWLRKWISEAFVGVLSGDALLYVWDVIFMYNWSKDIFVRICLSFLGLLRPCRGCDGPSGRAQQAVHTRHQEGSAGWR